jgi:LacI family transcriptional regulator
MSRRRKRTRRVALIIDTAKPYDRKIIGGIASYVQRHVNWSLYVEENPLDKLPDLRSWPGDGIIANFDDEAVAEAVSGVRIPVVAVGGGYGWYDARSSIPYFATDNRAVAKLGANHLIERGFRRFAFYGFPRNRINGWSKERSDAFHEFVTNAGFPCSVYTGRHGSTRQWVELQRGLTNWLDSLEKPLGLMACNDARARHALEACRTIRADVPDDVAVIGVDNDEMICELTRPPLTSVEQGARRIGHESARLLDRLMSGRKHTKKKYVVEPEGVVTRRSTDTVAIEDADVATALQFIRSRACEKIQVEDVVAVVAVSRSTLEARFKAVFGRTIHAEIQRQKIDRAKQLIATTEMPLKQIAARAGFASVQYMTSIFRQQTESTPAEYRQQCRL